MIILGINYYFEHPAVAIIKDGELIFAMEDERLTRIKHGKSYTPYKTYLPIDAIYSALKSCNLKSSDIDEIALSYNKWNHLKSLIGCFTGERLSSLQEELQAFNTACNFLPALKNGYEIPRRYRDLMEPSDFSTIKIKEWDHHISHAASAFYFSEAKEALVFVIDGSGERACSSVYLGREKNLKKLRQINLPHSLGFFYSFITEHLGFEPFSDEYKVMGLAAYGENKFQDEMKQLLQINEDGSYEVNIKLLKSLTTILGEKRKKEEPLQQIHKDIAKSTQVRLEEAVINLIKSAIKTTKVSDVCLAGGTFLNILVNSQIAKLPEVNSVFVQPASHDAGTAIGSAALSYYSNNNHDAVDKIKYDGMLLGTEYTNDEIKKYLEQSGVDFEVMLNPAQRIAELLNKENIVAHYRGRMEFGPRALGNRSLLASPQSERTKYKLNELKVREQFRPLAPLVLDEYFHEYFDGEKNRFMMFTVNVKKDKRELIPAITHADGTARSQVVYKEHDPFLHELLNEFYNLSGLPILINTSLNVRGKPIDESPYDAMASFYTSGVDYLVMGHFLVKHPTKK